MEKQQLDKIIEKIKSWMEFANENNDPFIKFAVEYFAFNALLRLNFSRNRIVRDRTLIRRLKSYLAHRDKQIIKPEHIEEFKKIETILEDDGLAKLMEQAENDEVLSYEEAINYYKSLKNVES